MSVLPTQGEWPPYLFRVTSSITFCRLSNEHLFISPFHQLPYKAGTTPEQKFSTWHDFAAAAMSHMKAEHELRPGAAFYSPFISTTSSFRYALSVAELHTRRGGKNVKITVIDTNASHSKSAVWDARMVAINCGIHLESHSDNYRDEFLIFGCIQGSAQCFSTVNYDDFIYKLGGFLPHLLDLKDEGRRRMFYNFWRDLPKRDSEFKDWEAVAAFKLARVISSQSRSLTIPFMAMMLCLEDRTRWGQPFLDEVSRLVREKNLLKWSDINAHYPCVFTATYKEEVMKVYDFLLPQWAPTIHTSTKPVKWTQKCMTQVGKALSRDQEERIQRRFGLSATGKLLSHILSGAAAEVIRAADNHDEASLQLLDSEYPGARNMADAFVILKLAVDQSTILPLKNLYTSIQALSADAPRVENVAECLSFWRGVFIQASLHRQRASSFGVADNVYQQQVSTPASQYPVLPHPVSVTNETIVAIKVSRRKTKRVSLLAGSVLADVSNHQLNAKVSRRVRKTMY